MPLEQNKHQLSKKRKKNSIDEKILDYKSFQTKKSIHVTLNKNTHLEFRKKLFDYELSMQEVFEWFAHLASLEDERALNILKEIKSNKRNKTFNTLKGIELENIYDALSEIDPLSER
jgi:hypothetical protein